jgi:hypothetical protein
MPVATERQTEQHGETCQPACCVHDLVQVFNGQLNNTWRYDQYIANAEGKPDLQNFWRNQKKHDQQACDQIRQLLLKELQR